MAEAELAGQWRSDRTTAAAHHNASLVLEVLRRRYRTDGIEGWIKPRELAEVLDVKPHQVAKQLTRLVGDDTIDHNGLLRQASAYRLGARWRATLDRAAGDDPGPVAPAGVDATLEDQGVSHETVGPPDHAPSTAPPPPEPVIQPEDVADVPLDLKAAVKQHSAAQAAKARANGRPTVEGTVLAEVSSQPGTVDEVFARLRNAGWAKRDVVTAILKLRQDGELEVTGERRNRTPVYRAVNPATA